MTRFNCLLPFDSDDPEFVRGFEAGRIYDLVGNLLAVDANDAEWHDFMPITVHAVNAEMVLRIAEALDCHARSVDLDDTWIEVTFARAAP